MLVLARSERGSATFSGQLVVDATWEAMGVCLQFLLRPVTLVLILALIQISEAEEEVWLPPEGQLP